ncbi:ABC transporter permease [Blautia schinkii]|nr:ABC transporter permease [Blautia schinkii]
MENKKQFNVKNFLIKYALIILILLLWVVYGVNSPYFFTVKNFKSLIVNAAPLLIYATGMTYILILGEIDLSIGSIGAVSASLWIMSMTEKDMPLAAAFGIAILTGLICGTVNAFLIIKLKINAFMVTLGMQFLLRGVCYLVVHGEQILTPQKVRDFAKLRLFTLSPLFYIGLLVAIIMMLVYKFTSYGRKVQATGCNKEAAKLVGVNVDRTKFIAFVLCGGLAGLAGAFQCINVGMLLPNGLGDGSEFLAITACVLGGTSLLGGVGSIIPGTLLGVVFYYSIENGLGLMGANVYVYPIVRGIVIFLAMVTDSLKRSIGTSRK